MIMSVVHSCLENTHGQPRVKRRGAYMQPIGFEEALPDVAAETPNEFLSQHFVLAAGGKPC
jgi:hypothetical protein